MDTFFSELDSLFDEGKIEEVEGYLLGKLDEAKGKGESSFVLTILNELIGYYREVTDKVKAKNTADDIVRHIEENGISDTVEAGTSYLNVATCFRFLKEYDESLKYYDLTEKLYDKLLDKADIRVAGLYNNKSMLYSEMGNFEASKDSLIKALNIVRINDSNSIKEATTLTNLAQAQMNLFEDEEALENLKKAKELYEKLDPKDSHLCGCLNALGMLYYKNKDYKKSAEYYEAALLNLFDTVGITDNYEAVRGNLLKAYEAAGVTVPDKMMDVCQLYFEKYGRDIIEKFPEYKGKIAAGLCGEGSECFGFDDKYSLDHDCGPGFSLWVDDETYEAIGQELELEYKKLPRVFLGFIRRDMSYSNGRVGVCTITGFFKRVFGLQSDTHVIRLINEVDLTEVDEYALAAAVNGKVFYDPAGVFSGLREKIRCYYPESVWKKKLAKALINAAQSGQYNYSRMMARGEFVTAKIALVHFEEAVMEVVYILNKTYMPYYKWQHKGLAELEILPVISDIMRAIADMEDQRAAYENFEYKGVPNENDMIAMTIEIIAKLIVNELNTMGLTKSSDTYLETQGMEILSGI